MDIIFCPYCLENTTIAEALQRRFRCQVCHECPMCGNLLGIRSQADNYFLQCNACQWSSKDLGIPSQRTSSEQWPEPQNPLDDDLNKVMNIVKGLGNYEKLERERKAQTTKRLSNLGILQNDRYALQNAYNMRKKALNQRPEPAENLSRLAPTSEIPELDSDFFTIAPDPGSTIGLSQIISHPVMGQNDQLYPTKVKMISRRALRCSGCDTMLYKGELSPTVVKPRLQSFAIDFFPDIRISRQIQLTPGQSSALFMTITNNDTVHQIDVKLDGLKCQEDKNCVNASSFSMRLTVPNKMNSADLPEGTDIDPYKISSRVVHVSRNVAGICVEYLVPDEIDLQNAYALLAFIFVLKSEHPMECKGELMVKLTN